MNVRHVMSCCAGSAPGVDEREGGREGSFSGRAQAQVRARERAALGVAVAGLVIIFVAAAAVVAERHPVTSCDSTT